MEYKKKKNGADRSDRNVFIGIGIACLIGLFVLMLLFNTVFLCGCSPSPDVFYETMTAIVATNDRVATLIVQTQVAATEQVGLTSTARP